MKRFLILLGTIVASGVLIATFWRASQPMLISSDITNIQAVSSQEGFARATSIRPLVFPQDHGPHLDYQTEWWYYTGNLDSTDGRHFGCQLTFFRHALTHDMPLRSSDLASNQVYFAHLAITDVQDNSHFATERFSRGAAELAGAVDSPFHVWLEDWQVASLSTDATSVRLYAKDGDHSIDLSLTSAKPLVLQGDNGLDVKSDVPGDASYYYSFTRLESEGTLQYQGKQFSVRGLSWMDHEFGTTSLGDNAVGWDWFSIQLNDDREIMYYQIRQNDGAISPFSAGAIVNADGSTRRINPGDATVSVLAKWTSPLNATYPSRWTVSIPSERLSLTLEPYVADQEMRVSIPYWEGAVRISGVSSGAAIQGNGYVEMTGYAGVKAPVR